MKQNIIQQSIRLLIASGLMLALMLTGCTTDKPGSGPQAITDPGNVKVNAKITGGTDVVRKDCQYRDIYGAYRWNNCHGFAWQCDYGVPTTLPNYAINSNGETKKFYENQYDGKPPCFTLSDGREEDKVVYSNDHSAVVYSTNPRMFISYCMDYTKPRIHRPDDPAGIYAYKNSFGNVSNYYHYHNRDIKGGIWSGDPIKVFYDETLQSSTAKKFAVEVNGTICTAYEVGNINSQKYSFVWSVNCDNHYERFHYQDMVTSSVDVQQVWSKYPQAKGISIIVYLTDAIYRAQLGYILFHLLR